MLLAVLLLLHAPPRASADSSAPVSCDAKMDSLIASPDFLEFAGTVRSANVERVALLQALMEDPEVEVVVEEQFSESSVFDFNENLEEVRAACVTLDFNQSTGTNMGTSLCLSAVSVSPVNTTFAPRAAQQRPRAPVSAPIYKTGAPRRQSSCSW